MTYTVWIWNENGWTQFGADIIEEWLAYFVAAQKSMNHGYTTLRDPTGTMVYAVFVFGNRVWHTMESNHG